MGCVPRYVLQAAAIATELDQNLDNVAAAEKWAYSDVQKALDEAISPDHPLKQKHLKDIADNILSNPTFPHGQKLQIYSVVPMEIYDKFEFQNKNYKTDKDEPVQLLQQVMQGLKQYAMKFDLKAAYLGKSPGVVQFEEAY
ncbi:7084_t:CDS:2 [Paraglomus brasilianum]|uniref:7084_t:CDS:1 n=1 Tax=Paraglomus brasilianum TaxID=144538 RepID=A0A9N9B9X4_9GLOM|nr:7084_t:CDS:2 [Paraglomus brasilianum]